MSGKGKSSASSSAVPEQGGNGNYTDEEQRGRAWRIIILLLILLGVGMYAYLATRSDPRWWPFVSVENSDDIQRFQWLYASAIGTFLYLLWEAHRKYVKIDEEPKKVDFFAYTPWYVVNVIRGPIIALVVMFALTNITLSGTLVSAGTREEDVSTTTDDASVTGNEVPEEDISTQNEGNEVPIDIGINLKNADQDVLAVVAFLLGFFSRLPFQLLKEIASSIFPKAWAKAYPDEIKEDDKVDSQADSTKK